MREIKFRAYDEVSKTMHYDFKFIASGREGNDWIIFISSNKPIDSNWRNNPYCAKQFKIMQYTGLKDKNGKEIYEDDIVLRRSDYPDVIGKVVYDCSGFYLESINENVEKIHRSLSTFPGRSSDEVIGNIFENPQLLKD